MSGGVAVLDSHSSRIVGRMATLHFGLDLQVGFLDSRLDPGEVALDSALGLGEGVLDSRMNPVEADLDSGLT